MTERSWAHGNALPDRITRLSAHHRRGLRHRGRSFRGSVSDVDSRSRPLLRTLGGRDRGDRGDEISGHGGPASESRGSGSGSIFSSGRGWRSWPRRSIRGRTRHFLEIGPGRGALTEPLVGERRAPRRRRNRSGSCCRPRRERQLPRVEVVEADILDVELAPLALPPATRVAGNLPYNISSPILAQLVAMQRETGRLHDATLMLQREVVDRTRRPTRHARLWTAGHPAGRWRPTSND